MRIMRHLSSAALATVAALSLAVASATQLAAQTSADREGVRSAVLDYVEGFYEGDTAKLVRSVRPEAQKYGFSRRRDSTTYNGQPMSWEQMLAFARGVKANNRPAPATAPKKIELLDVLDQTASAKLTAWWGTDYLLLAKYDGRWMVTHVLWQSAPPATP